MLRAEAGRNPIVGLGLPMAIEASTDLPNTAADADKPAIVKIDVGFPFDDVDTKTGVEPKLRASLMLVAVPMCRSMRRRARLMNYDGFASTRGQGDSLAARDCDDYHQYSKKFCETKHDPYPLLIGAIGRTKPRLYSTA
jgi:hypothetical protein